MCKRPTVRGRVCVVCRVVVKKKRADSTQVCSRLTAMGAVQLHRAQQGPGCPKRLSGWITRAQSRACPEVSRLIGAMDSFELFVRGFFCWSAASPVDIIASAAVTLTCFYRAATVSHHHHQHQPPRGTRPHSPGRLATRDPRPGGADTRRPSSPSPLKIDTATLLDWVTGTYPEFNARHALWHCTCSSSPNNKPQQLSVRAGRQLRDRRFRSGHQAYA